MAMLNNQMATNELWIGKYINIQYSDISEASWIV
jgi:hypothetical protein